MDLPKNRFKAALRQGRSQLGLWNTVRGPTVPELLGGAEFDWVLVDCEHSDFETSDVFPALQAIGQNPETSAIVRPASNDPILFKRLLDTGAQTLLVPYVQSASEAEAAVRAMRYGPEGIRGMAGMTRATRYGKVADYYNRAEEELCLVVQVETIDAIAQLEAIATTPGVDAVFIGPADLSASMGLRGRMSHPDVVAVIEAAFETLQRLNVPIGIMALNPDEAKRYIALGSVMTAVGVDLVLLAESVATLRAKF